MAGPSAAAKGTSASDTTVAGTAPEAEAVDNKPVGTEPAAEGVAAAAAAAAAVAVAAAGHHPSSSLAPLVLGTGAAVAAPEAVVEEATAAPQCSELPSLGPFSSHSRSHPDGPFEVGRTYGTSQGP